MLRRLCFVLIPSADENWKLWAQCSQVFVKLMFSIFSISVLNDNNYPCWVFCFVFWLGLRPLYIFSWFVVCFNKTLSQQGFPLLFSVKKTITDCEKSICLPAGFPEATRETCSCWRWSTQHTEFHCQLNDKMYYNSTTHSERIRALARIRYEPSERSFFMLWLRYVNIKTCSNSTWIISIPARTNKN
jgi:hypothetical protein